MEKDSYSQEGKILNENKIKKEDNELSVEENATEYVNQSRILICCPHESVNLQLLIYNLKLMQQLQKITLCLCKGKYTNINPKFTL